MEGDKSEMCEFQITCMEGMCSPRTCTHLPFWNAGMQGPSFKQWRKQQYEAGPLGCWSLDTSACLEEPIGASQNNVLKFME